MKLQATRPSLKDVVMIKKIFGIVGLAAILCVQAFGGGIDRVDIFDKADNHLLFITFDYDSEGNNTGRTVYASDSTFLRYTSLVKDGNGNVTSENSIDYDDNTLYKTSIGLQNNKTSLSIKDKFNMEILGAPISIDKSSAGEYSVSQSGSMIYKQKYEYTSDGMLKRINYTDPSGIPLYYATISQSTGTIQGGIQKVHPQLAPVFRAVSNGKLLVSFTVVTLSDVKVELFTLSGGLISKAAASSLTAGRRTLEVSHNRQLRAGTYIARISVNNLQVYHDRLMLVR